MKRVPSKSRKCASRKMDSSTSSRAKSCSNAVVAGVSPAWLPVRLGPQPRTAASTEAGLVSPLRLENYFALADLERFQIVSFRPVRDVTAQRPRIMPGQRGVLHYVAIHNHVADARVPRVPAGSGLHSAFAIDVMPA